MRSGIFWGAIALASCLALGASLAAGYKAGGRWAARTVARTVPTVGAPVAATAGQAAALPQAKMAEQVAVAPDATTRFWEAQPLPSLAQIYAVQKTKFMPALDWWISGSVVRQGKMCLIVELSAGVSPQFKCAGEALPGGAKLLRVTEGQAQVSTLVGSDVKNIVLEF